MREGPDYYLTTISRNSRQPVDCKGWRRFQKVWDTIEHAPKDAQIRHFVNAPDNSSNSSSSASRSCSSSSARRRSRRSRGRSARDLSTARRTRRATSSSTRRARRREARSRQSSSGSARTWRSRAYGAVKKRESANSPALHSPIMNLRSK